MLGSFIILFREAFEAALVVGIILSFLKRSGNEQYIKNVFAAVAAAIGTSVLVGVAINLLSIEFEGAAEQIFEGVLLLITAALLATLIVYMMRVKPSAKQIESEAKQKLMGGSPLGLFALVFFAVLREGVETVLFLVGLNVSSGVDGLLGGVLGLAAGVGLVYLLFQGIIRLNFGMLFTVTNTLLILIASGMVAYGVHELQEAGVIPIVIEHVWDINHILNEKEGVGAILKAAFGYNGNPSLIEVISYLVFMAGIIIASRVEFKRTHS